MTPKDFLKAVWPSDGIYCLATPFKIPNTDRVAFTHKTFATIAEAAAFVKQHRDSDDLLFAVHTLKQPRVWNPEKPNYKTGENGAWEVRKQDNMCASRAFFFDLDVDPDNHRKYATQGEAAADLKRFCAAAELPRPMVMSSGGGLHVYWLVEDDIPSQTWKDYAIKLRQIARHYELKFDPARTTDVSSMLRVAGTFNHKGGKKRPVEVKITTTIQPNKKFLKLIDKLVISTGVTVASAPKTFDGFESNLSEEFSGPPTTIKAVAEACAQMRYLIQQRGNVTEPEWYHSINLVRFLQNGEKLAHKISEGHPDYDPAKTDHKLAQLRAKDIKPTSCAKLAEVCGEERCEGCIFAGRVKSPIVAARYKDPAPAPVVVAQLGLQTITVTIPDPPKPYTRTKDGKIAMITKNKDGDELPTYIFDYDLYPVRRLVNEVSEIEQHVWCIVLPRVGAKEFRLDADALYDRRKFVAAIANNGVYPKTANLQDMQDYMIAYISELQRLTDADAQCNHLGWTDDKTKFILPDKMLLQDGTAKPVSLSLGAQRSSQHVIKAGTLQRQVELLRFYNSPAYLQHQFFILCGLAAPYFYATGHHGVIINATGDPGASKSTALYTAASLWGQPELYPINGTNNGATVRGRNARVTTLANLPICVDEITNIPVKEAVDLAMSITQPGTRIGLQQNGVERASVDSYKATIMLTTANNSLHSLLSADNASGTAGSMRVVEIQFKRTLAHTKSMADDYIYDLMRNYGHIGEQLMMHTIKHQKAVENMIRGEMRAIDTECNIQPGERFWSSPAAAAIAVGKLAVKLGLISYDIDAVRKWYVETQVPYMRGIVVEEYSTPITSLADYLDHANSNILIVEKSKGFGNSAFIPVRAVHGELLGRYEKDDKLMWLAIKPFKDWCIRQGINFRKMVEELHQAKQDETGAMHRVITSPNIKKVLGAGTDYAKAQSRTFVVNMDHPDVRGTIAIDETAEGDRPKLRVVK